MTKPRTGSAAADLALLEQPLSEKAQCQGVPIYDSNPLLSAMLHLEPIRQKTGDYPKRWMSDDYFDLILWYRDDRGLSLEGFQLTYRKYTADESALLWTRGGGYFHARVDTGDDDALANRTPILTDEEPKLPKGEILREFAVRAKDLPREIESWITIKVREYTSR